jgi:hypothetical protein
MAQYGQAARPDEVSRLARPSGASGRWWFGSTPPGALLVGTQATRTLMPVKYGSLTLAAFVTYAAILISAAFLWPGGVLAFSTSAYGPISLFLWLFALIAIGLLAHRSRMKLEA